MGGVRWDELDAEHCSFARTIAVIGDRWTLLILRECFLQVRRFDGFEARLGIARPILADRLRKLVSAGVLAKAPYGSRPIRYEYRLSSKGLDLYPVIMAVVHWGDLHTVGSAGRPLLHRHLRCGRDFDPVITCSECGEAVEPYDVQVRGGPGAAPSLQDRHTAADHAGGGGRTEPAAVERSGIVLPRRNV